MADVRLKAFAGAAAIFGLDRATKLVIEHYVSFSDTFKVIPGFFDIVRSQNRGVAFGMFNDSTSQWRTSLLIVISVAAVIGVSVALWNARRIDRLGFCALALVLGGAAGNLYDRLISGQVTDFLLFYAGNYQWPVFNIADSSIVIGCGLLLLEQIRPKRQTAHVP